MTDTGSESKRRMDTIDIERKVDEYSISGVGLVDLTTVKEEGRWKIQS